MLKLVGHYVKSTPANKVLKSPDSELNPLLY